jgi:hypothetical protein
MKIYRFNPATGIYLGEDFADEASLKEGICEMPVDATTIPPPQVKHGETPVFRTDNGKWEVRQLSQLKNRMEETCGPILLNPDK